VEWADLLDGRLSRRLSAAGQADAQDEYAEALLDGEARVLALERDRRMELAVASVLEAEAGMAGSPLPVLTRARTLRIWGDRTREAARRRQRLAEARGAYSETIALAPGWPEVLDEAALSATLAGDPASALELTRRAVALDPFFRRAWRTAAEAHAALGEQRAAADAYGRYFEDYRNKSDLPALRGWMEALASDGQIDDAIQRAREIQRLQPSDAGALADLAQLLLLSGDLAGAQEAARDALELAPEDAAIRRLMDSLDASNGTGGGEF
jgi:Flp pilus assembly protein TadD